MPLIPKAGGIQAPSSLGSYVGPRYNFDPEDWLVSMKRGLEAYVKNGFQQSVTGRQGDLVYEVIFEFPSGDMMAKKVPLKKPVIHFEVDEIRPSLVGFGDNVFAWNFNETDYSVKPQEAAENVVNFDVGIWTSDTSGGTTTRLRIYQILEQLFIGKRAKEALLKATDGGDGGVEILRYRGGRFLSEHINDVLVYRMVDSELEVRVFSRTPKPFLAEPAIQGITQDPQLTIP
jgi:hypothetical protein